MTKELFYGRNARKRVAKGIRKSARATNLTLGYAGRNTMIENPGGEPRITNDGGRISRELSFKDPGENLGASLVKALVNRASYGARTTTVNLYDSMVGKGMQKLRRGLNVMEIRSGMDIACSMAVEMIKEVSVPVTRLDQMIQVATISSEDSEIGEAVADMVEKVGKHGVITVEESRGTEIEYDVVKGVQIDSGYMAESMVTHKEVMESVVENALILIIDNTVTSADELLPILKKVSESGVKDLVIVLEDIRETNDPNKADTLTIFAINRTNKIFNVLAIKAPGYGNTKTENLSDLAVVTGATVITKEIDYKNVTLDMLGTASRVVSTNKSTLIMGAGGKKEAIDTRVKYLQSLLGKDLSAFEEDKIETRIAKISGGIGVIKVGAPVGTEISYLKDKISDAVRETRASVQEGVVIGGGTTLATVAYSLRLWKPDLSPGMKAGYEIVTEALEKPLVQIMRNAGIGWYARYKILREIQNTPGAIGFDARRRRVCKDMFDEGIIDSLKTTCLAVQNSVSASGIFLTSDCAIVSTPQSK